MFASPYIKWLWSLSHPVVTENRDVKPVAGSTAFAAANFFVRVCELDTRLSLSWVVELAETLEGCLRVGARLSGLMHIDMADNLDQPFRLHFQSRLEELDWTYLSGSGRSHDAGASAIFDSVRISLRQMLKHLDSAR